MKFLTVSCLIASAWLCSAEHSLRLDGMKEAIRVSSFESHKPKEGSDTYTTVVTVTTFNGGYWQWIKSSSKTADPQPVYLSTFEEGVGVETVLKAQISEIIFPELGAKGEGSMVVTLRSEGLGETVVAKTLPTSSKKWQTANFRFELGDLPCDRVAKVDSFSWTQKTVEAFAFNVPEVDVPAWKDAFDGFTFSPKQNPMKGSIVMFDDFDEELMRLGLEEVRVIALEGGKAAGGLEVSATVQGLQFEW